LAWQPNWRRLVVGWEREIQMQASFLSPCLHPDYIEAVLKWLLGINEVDSLSSSNGIGHLTHQRHHHLSIEKEEGIRYFGVLNKQLKSEIPS